MKYEEPLLSVIDLETTAILTITSGGEWSGDIDGSIDGDELGI